MAYPPPYPDTNDDTGDTRARPTEDRPPSTPRWVKVFGIIGIVIVILVVVMLIFGGGPGGHGPGRHTPSGAAGGQTLLSSVMEDRAPPEVGRG